jgi:hypothetical protein
MALSWKRRLGISASVICLMLWIAGYLMDPSKNIRQSMFGIVLFGVVPVLICWSIWWVWSALGKVR